jgi:sialic acid synthase SpsE
MEPDEFELMVRTIREVEQALGSANKVVSPSERVNIPIARRGLYAARPIAVGSQLTTDDVIALRPEAHISPMRYDAVIGATATRAYATHEALDFDGLTPAR